MSSLASISKRALSQAVSNSVLIDECNQLELADTKLELADAQSIEEGYSEEAENAVANLVAE